MLLLLLAGGGEKGWKEGVGKLPCVGDGYENRSRPLWKSWYSWGVIWRGEGKAFVESAVG